MNRRIIVFAPHPDDETLGCGGTIARKIEEGHGVVIVVMTDGRHAFSKVLGLSCDPSPDELKQIRKEEVTKAARILGVPKERLVFLDFEDGTLRDHEKEVEAIVNGILEENSPTEIYFPSEKDYNIDHQAANHIIRNAIERLSRPTLEYEYSITQSFARIGPFLDRLANLFKSNLVEVDISEFLPLKKAAIEEFRSQLTILSTRQERPILTKTERFLKKNETFFLRKSKT